MASPENYMEWDLSQISRALKLTESDVIEYFTDGRRVSFICERKIRDQVGGKLAKTEGAGYDLLQDQKKWEVRSITKGGTYFSPSFQVGSGRKFDEEGFLKKLDEIEGYILCDILEFPKIPYWRITSETVRSWYDNNQIGVRASTSRKNILSLINNL